MSKVHFVGVGGTGMLPLALLMAESGHQVSGSDDLMEGSRLDLLTAQGVDALSGADAARITDVDRVVISPAIPQTHPERRAAWRKGIAMETRAEALATLVSGREAICVAGSHGKSTTTAMLVQILEKARGPDFGYMIGAAPVFNNGIPARLGQSDTPFVMEACEAYGALTYWRPAHLIVTNIDDDHSDHYEGEAGLGAAFSAFLSKLPLHGHAVICGDDAGVKAALPLNDPRILTYGFGVDNRLRAVLSGEGNILLYDGKRLGSLPLSVPGSHNLLNAMAALGMAMQLGIGYDVARSALTSFTGVVRRLQNVGRPDGPRIFDDFAHHPSEIAASLAAVSEDLPGRLIAVLEPQLHSRVVRLAPAFAEALLSADRSFILPVSALGEATHHADGNAVLAAACDEAGVAARFVSGLPELIRALMPDLRADDTLVFMAGRSGEGIAKKLADALTIIPADGLPVGVLHGRQTPAPPDLLSLVAAHTAAYPDAPAVEMGHRRLSYAELAARASNLARALEKTGVKPQDCVGVCLGRSIDRLVAFLALLRLDAVFLPLDPAQPAGRLAYMLEDSGTRIVIVNPASPALPELGLHFINCANLPEGDGGADNFVPPGVASPAALAYLIYTSGTTGRPKGVEIDRGALANYAIAAAGHFDVTRQSRYSQVCGFGFDVSVGDMAVALAAGACLVFPTDIQAQPGAPSGRFVAQGRLSHLSLTPSALSVIPTGDYPDLTHVIVVGEACPASLVERWGGGRCFINAYGPTEATVEATFAVCTPNTPVTIGLPFDNMSACVLDEQLRLVAPGDEGELCLSGPGLARGYRNLPDLTAERFPIIDPEGRGPVRIYRTGDRVRVGTDGHLRFLGRLDDQVKFHGYRIEPGDIEAALCRLPDIREAAVSFLSRAAGDQLIAHIVLRPGALPLDTLEVRKQLGGLLPAYMVPSVFLPVPEIPRNANGKRDRGALPLPPQLDVPRKARTTGNMTEAQLMRLVADHIGTGAIEGTRDSLIAAGIDSLAMAELLFSIEETFGITLDMRFEEGFDTVEVLALMVDSQLDAPLKAAPWDQAEAMIAKIRPHLATWPGKRFGEAGLARSLNTEGALHPLFWCSQSGNELEQLTRGLDGRVPLYGLRSGHLVFDYSAENLRGLAEIYADEVTAIAPEGTVFLGGNCQGGMIMREVGLELLRRDREVALTILMEQGRFPSYPGKVLLLFGAGSYLNPYGQIEQPEAVFRLAYPGSHRVEIIPGGHGQYFRPENVSALADAIVRYLTKSLAPSDYEAMMMS